MSSLIFDTRWMCFCRPNRRRSNSWIRECLELLLKMSRVNAEDCCYQILLVLKIRISKYRLLQERPVFLQGDLCGSGGLKLSGTENSVRRTSVCRDFQNIYPQITQITQILMREW